MELGVSKTMESSHQADNYHLFREVLKIKGGESEIDKVGTSTGIGIDDKN
jgi:hypothetical protein